MASLFELRPGAEGITLLRGGKPLLTPARHELRLPGAALAQAVAREWEAAGEGKIDPARLPLTGFAALALDIVGPQRKEITEELLDYGETDLLLYREGGEIDLRRQQERLWQPWLDWAVQQYGTQYRVTYEVTPAAQDSRNRGQYRAALTKLDPWQLAGLAVVVKCAASLILGLAFLERRLDATRLHELARLEEAHNIAQWGEEPEAAAKEAATRMELENAQRWRDLLLTEALTAAT